MQSSKKVIGVASELCLSRQEFYARKFGCPPDVTMQAFEPKLGHVSSLIPCWRELMRAPGVTCLFGLSLFTVGAALGQPADPAQPGKSADDIQAIKQRAAEWLTTCLGDWDAQTHMSKSEWQTTCVRVSKEREQFLLNTPGAISIGTKAAR